MTGWHCLKDFSRYCEPEPVFDEVKEAGDAVYQNKFSTCKLEPETCGRCKKIEEQVDLSAPWLSNPTFVENLIPIEKVDRGNGNGNGNKPKSAKAKKLEAEMAQRKMI